MCFPSSVLFTETIRQHQVQGSVFHDGLWKDSNNKQTNDTKRRLTKSKQYLTAFRIIIIIIIILKTRALSIYSGFTSISILCHFIFMRNISGDFPFFGRIFLFVYSMFRPLVPLKKSQTDSRSVIYRGGQL